MSKKENIIKLNLGGSNSYLIQGKAGYLLVDTGLRGALNKIKRQLYPLGIDISEITHILITHDHYDHTGGLAELKLATNAQVIIHEAELKDNSSNVNKSNRFFRGFVKVFGSLTPKGKPEEKIKPDIILKGDMDIRKMGFSANIIHTPGHTPGSVCLVTDEGECCVGDTLFSIFPGTHYPIIVFDRKILADSYRKLNKLGCNIYYPGHGDPITKENFTKRIMNKSKYLE